MLRMPRLVTVILACALAVTVLGTATPAVADGGDGRDERVDIRRTGTCSAASRTKLRLRAEDGRIRVELEVDTTRAGMRWAVVLLHERRIVFRGGVRTRSGGSLELRREVADWFGPDLIEARSTGPGGEACRVAGTV